MLQAKNGNFKTWKAVVTNVRFRSWSSKPLNVGINDLHVQKSYLRKPVRIA